jgi:hypothetical protein
LPHADTFAHKKRSIACQDNSQQPKTIADYRTKPHRKLKLSRTAVEEAGSWQPRLPLGFRAKHVGTRCRGITRPYFLPSSNCTVGCLPAQLASSILSSQGKRQNSQATKPITKPRNGSVCAALEVLSLTTGPSAGTAHHTLSVPCMALEAKKSAVVANLALGAGIVRSVRKIHTAQVSLCIRISCVECFSFKQTAATQ